MNPHPSMEGMCGIASMDWSFKKLIGSIKWDEIAKLFPSLFGQHSAVLQPSESNDPALALKIGVVCDYVHVVDLVGHRFALRKLSDLKIGCEVHKLGNGKGTSILEMVESSEKASVKMENGIISTC
ncbi:hypothetical protein Tco_0668810 [Tanacetum coccineum]